METIYTAPFPNIGHKYKIGIKTIFTKLTVATKRITEIINNHKLWHLIALSIQEMHLMKHRGAVKTEAK